MSADPSDSSLHEFYRQNPDEADHLLFGRRTHPDRRGFLRNAETPPHLLDDAITPTSRHFVRNNGLPPVNTVASGWTLTIDGLVDSPVNLSLDILANRFDVVTRALTLECAGNGRAFFDPSTKGEQWTYGAVACSEWTGEGRVSAVELSIDGATFGATWMGTTLDDPVNSFAWQNWRASVAFPLERYYEIWARGTDSRGVCLPHAIAWNPGGYLNNAMHRVAVYIDFK